VVFFGQFYLIYQKFFFHLTAPGAEDTERGKGNISVFEE
jgi:hypothetical protein